MEFDHFRYLVDHMFAVDGGVQPKYRDMHPAAMHPLVLAYIGDAYFNLYVRTKLLGYEQNKVQVLHRFGAQIVSAACQAVAYRGIEALLTEEERDVYRRGRNANSRVPKSATVAEYRSSTGFEALFGYLYLTQSFARLEELAEASFALVVRDITTAKER